jgi:peroxiredoxin
LMKCSMKFVEIDFSIRMLQIRNDERVYDALICEPCLNQVKQAYDLRQKIKEFKEKYFTLKSLSMQSCCKTESPKSEVDIKTVLASDDEAEMIKKMMMLKTNLKEI